MNTTKDRLTRLDDAERVIILSALYYWVGGLERQTPIDWDLIARVYRIALVVGTRRKGRLPVKDLDPAWLGFRSLKVRDLVISHEIGEMAYQLAKVNETVQSS